MERPRASHLLLLAVVAAVALAPGIATIPLVETTEGRYASIAAGMVETGDWLVPRYNGFPHLEKPPLTYWLAAASIRLFGKTEWAVRLPCLLAGVGLVLVTAWLGATMFGRRAGVVGAALLVGCLHFAGIERILSTDPFLALSAAVAMATFWEGYRAERGSSRDPQAGPARRRCFFLFQLALAAGVMAKGPLGLLWTIPPVVTALVATRQLRLLARMRWGVGLLLLLGTLGAWIAALDVALPGAGAYLVLDRATAAARSAEGFHTGPWWFYLTIVPAGAFPWVLLAPEACSRWRTSPPQDLVGRTGRWLLLGWVAVPFLVLSASPAKLPSYAFPMFPALALLAAWGAGDEARGARRVAFSTATFLVAIGVAALVCPADRLGKSISREAAERIIALAPMGIALPAFLGAAVAIASGLFARGAGRLLGAAAAMAVLCGALAAMAGSVADEIFASKAVALRLRAEARAGDQVVFYQCNPSSVPFYTGLRAILIEYVKLKVPDRLADEISDARYWNRDDPEEIRALLAGPRRILAIAKVRDYERIVRENKPVREIMRTAHEVLFTARDAPGGGEGGRDTGWHRKR